MFTAYIVLLKVYKFSTMRKFHLWIQASRTQHSQRINIYFFCRMHELTYYPLAITIIYNTTFLPSQFPLLEES